MFFHQPTLRGMAMGLVVLASTFGSAPAFAEAPQPAGTTKVWIVHTNDLHGNLEPDSKGRGGLARVATLLEKLREEHPGQVIYLEAGDIAQGTPVSNTFHGKPMFEVLNDLKPAAGTIGNHEFDWGPAKMREMTSWAKYHLVVANLVDSKGNRVFKPFTIVQVKGVKIAVIGLLTPETPIVVKKGNTAGYQFLDPAATVKKYLPAMRKQGAEFIVAVTHQGVDADKALAAAVPEIDAIVGGHSHTKLAKAEMVGDTPIVQADKYGRHVGILELTLDAKTDKVVAVDSKLIEINDKAGLEADPDVVAIVKKYNDQVKPLMAKVVGQAGADMPKKQAEAQLDSPLGNVIADALRQKTNSDVAVYNWGGIRDENLPGGAVTMETVFRILPFDDQVVQLQLKGSDLVDLIGQGALNKEGAMQVSGLQIAVDTETKQVVEVKVNGNAIDPNATYTVATTEFLAGGGDGYNALTKGRIAARYDFAREVFVDYLDDVQVLQVPATGRIQVMVKQTSNN